ncbi:MAG: hypothetical protein JW808_08235, partial [Victivallales bacterium]|nr:hypothetical protein [Victivallales bacterium]
MDTNYQQSVKPVNPEGKTAVDKWGSSFDTWSMSASRWEGVQDFRWGWKGFPVMWTKKPELYGGTAAYLAFQDGHGSAETLTGEELEK